MASDTALPNRFAVGPFCIVIFVSAALASVVCFWRLGVKPLENWDEGIHAEVTREMVASKAWISMTYRDALYTAKPPLKFWLTAPLFAWSGATEFNARFWSALAGVLTTVLLSIWGWQLNRSIRFGLLVGSLFLAGRFVMYHSFRTGETDGLLLLFLILGMYAYWMSWVKPRWFILFGVATGLAVMTKSAAGALLIVIVGIDVLLARRWRSIGLKMVLYGAGAALLLALPWHIIETVRYGMAFWKSYLGFNIFQRSSEVLYANNVSWFWYGHIIAIRWIPFAPLIPIALILAVRRLIRDRDALDRLLLIWAVLVFIVFSLVKTKFDWYILPIYPALAFLVARGLTEFFHDNGKDWFLRWSMVLSFAVIVYRFPQDLVHAGFLWHMTPFAYVPVSLADAVLGKISVIVVSIGAILLLALVLKNRTVVLPQRLIGIALTLYLLGMVFGWQFSYLRHIPTASPAKEVAMKVQELRIQNLDVLGINLKTQPALYFYLRRINGLNVVERGSAALTSMYVLTTADELRQNTVRPGNAILIREPFALIERVNQGEEASI